MTKLKEAVTGNDHAQGPADAPCTLVEYGDYQCPSCRVAMPEVHRVQKHFGDRLRFVFRNFPLEQHEFAEEAAETAEFAAAQGKFWEMHDALYRNQPRLGEGLFPELASKLSLDAKALTKALEEGSFSARVRADLEGGMASGVQGTPTFYLNGVRHDGEFGAETLIASIEAAMRG